MTTYEPGTVAMVECSRTGCVAMRHRALRTAGQTWLLHHDNGTTEHVDDHRLRVWPLVCIEATREDADALDTVLRAALLEFGYVLSDTPGPTTLRRIRDAIRGQTPEPEPEKRWTVEWVTGCAGAAGILYDHGSEVARFNRSDKAQSIADLLNELEPTP